MESFYALLGNSGEFMIVMGSQPKAKKVEDTVFWMEDDEGDIIDRAETAIARGTGRRGRSLQSVVRERRIGQRRLYRRRRRGTRTRGRAARALCQGHRSLEIVPDLESETCTM